MTIANLTIRVATSEDIPALEQIRQAAFAPVFSSFRKILGDVIYETAQAHEDNAQEEMLRSLFHRNSPWKVYVAENADKGLTGFVSFRCDEEKHYGEIGLNAVAPECAGMGIGTAMYEFALAEMKQAGMRVATVATGGDPSHTPARRAYEKAGFNVVIPSVWMCRTL